MKEYIKTIALSVFLLIVVAAGVGIFAWSYKFDKYCYELGCKGDFNVSHFIAQHEEKTRKKVHSLLQAVGGRIKDGERKIIECPNCGHKVYALRESGILRVSCGGCNINASAEYLSELKINIAKSHI